MGVFIGGEWIETGFIGGESQFDNVTVNQTAFVGNLIASAATIDSLSVTTYAGDYANIESETINASSITTLSAESGTVDELTTKGLYGAYRIETTTYTVSALDEVIVFNSETDVTAILPVASGSGRKITIKNINTGTVTVECTEP